MIFKKNLLHKMLLTSNYGYCKIIRPFNLTISHVLNRIEYTEAWPSGKAGACKALIPSSNLGASFSFVKWGKDFLLFYKN